MTRALRLGLAVLLSVLTGPTLSREDAVERTIVRPSPQGDLHLGAWLFVPTANRPVGAVILLHGCNGLDPFGWRHAILWAQRINQDGYAALILDSFGARGLSNICGHGDILPPDERAGDVYAAAAELAKQPEIRSDTILAMGFSHGGWTALHAATDPASGKHLAAVVAFYPGCRDLMDKRVLMPALILMGSLDDWTPVRPCERLVAQSAAQSDMLQIHVFDGALHSFDVDRAPRVYQGHSLAFDAAADLQSQVDVKAFLSAFSRNKQAAAGSHR